MLNRLSPKNIKELRGFLGLTGYYRKFVSGYGKVVWALTKQLKKDQFGWNAAAEESFHQLKKATVSVPILALPYFTKPFIIETDAFRIGLGAVLMQDQRPIEYCNRALPPRARLKSIYEREFMAIVFFCSETTVIPTMTKVCGEDKSAEFEVYVGSAISECGAPTVADQVTWV